MSHPVRRDGGARVSELPRRVSPQAKLRALVSLPCCGKLTADGYVRDPAAFRFQNGFAVLVRPFARYSCETASLTVKAGALTEPHPVKRTEKKYKG